jgi:UDP-N-acetylmuramate dehydrogenase
VNFQVLRPPCRKEIALSGYTSLGIGGRADLFFTPRSVAGLREDLRWLKVEGIPVRVLGGGTNVVCRDEGFRGAVISTTSLSRACHEGPRIRAHAGYPLAALVRKCCNFGLSGTEPLAGIPGTIGGATIMNAGGRYGNIGPLLEEVRTLTLEGEERVYHNPAERFTYRKGDFGNEIVTEVLLALKPSSSERVRKETRRILREKFAAQPLSARSAGCVFRNPPHHSAGRLIDACGLKGIRLGGMRISPVHANFIINSDGGTCHDFTELAELARVQVRKRFGINLEFEVRVF